MKSPKLRFKKNTDNWVTEELGDFVAVKNGYVFQKNHIDNNGNYYLITISNLQNGRVILDDQKKCVLPTDIKDWQKLGGGEILVALSGSTTGKCAINTNNNCLLNQRIASIICDNKSINKNFLKQILLSHTFYEYLLTKGKARSGNQPNASNDDIKYFKISFPTNLQEQQAIASFFSNLDEIQETLNKQLENVKLMKQYYLNKLFPKQNKTLPELRFKDFIRERDWEIVMLKDVINFSSGNNISKIDLLPYGKIPVIHYSELYTNYSNTIYKTINFLEEAPINQKYGLFGDILLPKTTTAGCGWDMVEPSVLYVKDVAIGSDIIIMRSKLDSLFVNYLLRSNVNRNLIASTSSGSTGIKHLSEKKIANIISKITTIQNEQKMISMFLNNIDILIQSLFLQVSKVELIKQYYLGRMFC